MNPPYGNHGHGIDEDFLEKTLHISNIIVSVQPLSWLITLKQNKRITDIIDKCGIDIEDTNALSNFDGSIIGLNAIQYINMSKPQKIIYNGAEFEKCIDVKIYANDKYMVEFAHKIDYSTSYNNSLNGDSLDDYLKKNAEPGNYYVEIPKLRGHKTKNGKSPDFYTIISNNIDWFEKNKKGILTKDIIDSNIIYFSFKGKDIADNFINYLQTDFVRACLYLTKFNMNILSGRMLRSIPWFDFSDEHFSKTPHEIDNWLFDKYNISNEIRKHIEEILPDYYNIRPKNK